MKKQTIVWLTVIAVAIITNFIMIFICISNNCMTKELFKFFELNILVLLFCAGFKIVIEIYEKNKRKSN